MDYYYSDCCGALPKNTVDIDENLNITGMCEECNEWTTFYENDEGMIDWEDQIEYIMNHLEE